MIYQEYVINSDNKPSNFVVIRFLTRIFRLLIQCSLYFSDDLYLYTLWIYMCIYKCEFIFHLSVKILERCNTGIHLVVVTYFVAY